jgi:hypothetical protein
VIQRATKQKLWLSSTWHSYTVAIDCKTFKRYPPTGLNARLALCKHGRDSHPNGISCYGIGQRAAVGS